MSSYPSPFSSSDLSSLSSMSSQAPSVAGSPSPDAQSAKRSLDEEPEQRDHEQQQAPKRRRTSKEPKPRTTEYLDLDHPDCETLHADQILHLLKYLRNKRKIVVVAGAGISVSSGST